MKKITAFVLFAIASLFSAQSQAQDKPTFTTTREWRPLASHPDGGHVVRFIPIDKIRKAKAARDADPQFDHTKFKAPALPIDWAKTINFPMDGNDRYGDCYYAAMAHFFDTMHGNNGIAKSFSLGTFASGGTGILNRYRVLSGGDNGLNDSDIQGEGMNRYCADITDTKFVSWANVDVTSPAAVQTAIYNYGAIFFTFAVPNVWINNSDTGAIWDTGTPNQNNGHAVIWNGVDKDGKYKLQTWGSYVWITVHGVTVCDPAGWVAFTPKWFNTAGYAPNGIHIVDLAKSWMAATGKTIPASVISSFPPPNVNPPPPPPPPTPPTNLVLKSITETYTNGMSKTYDVIPTGAASKIQELLDLFTPPSAPTPIPTPIPDASQKRIEELERNLSILTDAFLKLQKAIAGEATKKTSKLISPVNKEFDNARFTWSQFESGGSGSHRSGSDGTSATSRRELLLLCGEGCHPGSSGQRESHATASVLGNEYQNAHQDRRDVYPDIRVCDAVRIERHLSRIADRASQPRRAEQQYDSLYADRA